jgi:4-amino-4-deoxy-L-arabinose transferase-like glycosyltransferase
VATLTAHTKSAGSLTAERCVLLLIAVTLLGRIVFAGTIGLGIDESYTIATSRTLALSTFDHPPLAWWLAGAARWLFGTEAALAVRLPFILLFALTTWLMFALTRLLFGSRAALFAAVTLNLAPVLAWTSGSFVLPDGPLIAALVAGAYCLARVLFASGSASPLWWLAAGACGGIACLSKLHGVFLFAGTALFLLTTPSQRRWLLTPWPYLGVAVAALVFLPVIVWNAQHDWALFAFQGGRARIKRVDLLAPLVTLAGQAIFILPWLWVPLVISLARAAMRGPSDDRGWLVVCLAVGPILAFTLVAASGTRVLYHWAAPGYLFAFALLGRDLASIAMGLPKRAQVWLASTAASLIVLLVAVLALARLPWPPVAWSAGKLPPYPLIETVSWSELGTELSRRGLLDRPNLFIAATRWHEAGRADLALRGRLPVRCLCSDARGYGVLYKNAESDGLDALIVGEKLTRARVDAAYGACFAAIEQLTPVTLHQAGAPIGELQLFLGRRYTPHVNGAPCGGAAAGSKSTRGSAVRRSP